MWPTAPLALTVPGDAPGTLWTRQEGHTTSSTQDSPLQPNYLGLLLTGQYGWTRPFLTLNST